MVSGSSKDVDWKREGIVRQRERGKQRLMRAAACAAKSKRRHVCQGSGPAHVRVSGPSCELNKLLVNTASIRGSEENNHQGFGGKLPSTHPYIFRRIIVIYGTSNKWGESSEVATYYFCCLFYFLLCSSRSRKASCNSSRGSNSGGRMSSHPKWP
jgi:hypothetical protein